MKIELKEITVRELTQNYSDKGEEGVKGLNNKLDVRPAYQREFVYNEKQRAAVINTIEKNYPLNVIYWSNKGNDEYEIIDGQQRTISICQFVTGGFAYNYRYFHNLEKDEQEKILDYKLMVYVCTGTDSKKLEWFKTINIVGEKLTNQELRNAVYTGEWLSDAKKYFSKTKCPAYEMAKKLITGQPIRQDYLETVLSWISDNDVEEYMAKHQIDSNANELWIYFNQVITWVNTIFSDYRKEMKGLDYGEMYKEYHTVNYDTKKLSKEIEKLMLDDEVTNKKGIYMYVLSRNEKYLNIRAFSEQQKRELYEKQKGLCPVCGTHFEMKEMEADHIVAWVDGGKTNVANGQMLCKHDNRTKSSK